MFPLAERGSATPFRTKLIPGRIFMGVSGRCMCRLAMSVAHAASRVYRGDRCVRRRRSRQSRTPRIELSRGLGFIGPAPVSSGRQRPHHFPAGRPSFSQFLVGSGLFTDNSCDSQVQYRAENNGKQLKEWRDHNHEHDPPDETGQRLVEDHGYAEICNAAWRTS
jgi:hypothetical protein